MKTCQQVCAFAISLLGAFVLLAAVPLASTLIELERIPGQALAHDRDDDDGDHHDSNRHRHHGDEGFQIRVLSGRPDTVAGGDALVRISVKNKHARASDVRIELNGTNITDAFVANNRANTLTGLVTGMRLGHNELEVSAKRKGHGRADADIVLTNYPIEGPVFSGPHEEPFFCQTHQFNLPAGLGPLTTTELTDPCHVPTRVDYIYRTNATPSALAQWPAGATTYPSNMAMTATGKPYIVRVETGTVNRSIYQIAMLHDPIAQPAAPSWRKRSANWNGRLVFNFGGGCPSGWYRQGANTGGVTDDFILSQGYALPQSSLNVAGNNCNNVTTAESMMMVKERFIENYGAPGPYAGLRLLGGSYQQHEITDNYPGLLDGLIPGCSFPDVTFALLTSLTDAWLLDTYFKRSDIDTWTTEQKRQVSGFLKFESIAASAAIANRIDPDGNCGIVPVEMRYNAVTNPTGVRCTIYDHAINIYGRDPATGFARRPLDNEGIQYGLKLVNSGDISVEQFLNLNEKIGGFDKDANIVPQRTQADLLATRISYRTGRMTNAGAELAAVPIIDYRAYVDNATNGEVHLAYHSFSMRKRLENENRRSDNQVMVLEDSRFGLYSSASPLLQRMVTTMDRSITAIKADKRKMSMADKIAANKPADLLEGCNTGGTSPTFMPETLVREQEAATACNQLYPSNSFPREVAGADIAANIIKCQRRTPRQSDYVVPFTSAQWARLQAIFPTGVCNWSRPGYEQQDLKGTWLDSTRSIAAGVSRGRSK